MLHTILIIALVFVVVLVLAYIIDTKIVSAIGDAFIRKVVSVVTWVVAVILIALVCFPLLGITI